MSRAWSLLLKLCEANGGFGSVEQFRTVQSVSSVHAAGNSVGEKICSPNKDRAPLFIRWLAKQLKSCSGVAILSRLLSHAIIKQHSGRHGAFHTPDLESTGINHEALWRNFMVLQRKTKEHLTNVVCEVKVSRLVKFMFSTSAISSHESKDGGESFMCFGPESSRNARERVR